MTIDTLGAATISISGALFATASLWSLIGVLLDLGPKTPGLSATRAHLLASGLTVIAGLVTHILGFFSEAFALLYAGGASMLVATAIARTRGTRARTRVLVPGILTAAGLVLLTVGLLLQA